MDPINAEYRVMSPVPLYPNKICISYFVTFGRSGQAYVDTDPKEADASTIVRKLLGGNTID
jgi:hypothetical protein